MSQIGVIMILLWLWPETDFEMMHLNFFPSGDSWTSLFHLKWNSSGWGRSCVKLWASGSFVEHPVLNSASAAHVPSTGAHSSLDLAPAYAHPELVQKLPAPTPALRRLEEEYQQSLQIGVSQQRCTATEAWSLYTFSWGSLAAVDISEFCRMVHCLQESCFYNTYVGTLTSISCQCRNTQYKKEADFCHLCLDFAVLNFFIEKIVLFYESCRCFVALCYEEQSSGWHYGNHCGMILLNQGSAL